MSEQRTSNLVARLREWNGNSFGPYKSPVPDLLEAAAEIERLRAALAQALETMERDDEGYKYETHTVPIRRVAAIHSARSALPRPADESLPADTPRMSCTADEKSYPTPVNLVGDADETKAAP